MHLTPKIAGDFVKNLFWHRTLKIKKKKSETVTILFIAHRIQDPKFPFLTYMNAPNNVNVSCCSPLNLEDNNMEWN